MNIPEEVQNYSAISSGIFLFVQNHPELYHPTEDWFVYYEEAYPEIRNTEYIRYVNLDGRRWEVWGKCDKRGDCLGEITDITKPDRLDMPVTPELKSCCGIDIFRYVELPKLVIDNGN